MKEDIKFTIYLAGHHKDIEYRKYVTENYGNEFNLIDPMTITFKDVYSNIGEELSDIFIVQRDKKLIDKCDFVIAKVEYLPQGEIIIGTLMEIIYAYSKGIPVFLVSSSYELLNNPWLKFHCTAFFNSIEECIEYIGDDKNGF